MVGCNVGFEVGLAVGTVVGFADGARVGDLVGLADGDTVGLDEVGRRVGLAEG